MKNLPVQKQSFQQATWPAILIGSICTSVFYGLIISGPLRFPFFVRYCLSHPVAIVSVALFACAIVMLLRKLFESRVQRSRLKLTQSLISEMVNAAPSPKDHDRVDWLITMWQTQPAAIRNSWLGSRITNLLDRQSQRDNSDSLDDDIRDLSYLESDRQSESYGFIRIVIWAMPMLGFLGTVLGISTTLGRMDTQSLASGSQEAMDRLTGGLYVAFDTTAVGLVLTVAAMFVQFLVNRSEQSIVARIDSIIISKIGGVLQRPRRHEDSNEALLLVRELADRLGETISSVVEQQAELWQKTIDDSHARWSQLTDTAGEEVRKSISESLQVELTNHVDRFEIVQREGAEQIETRWQQWQTTMSDHARVMQGQQQLSLQQVELLNSLVADGGRLKELDSAMQMNLQRLTDIDRFHEAAVCLTEAVAMLGTQLERRGMIGRQKLRRNVSDNQTGQPLKPANSTNSAEKTSEPPQTISLEEARRLRRESVKRDTPAGGNSRSNRRSSNQDRAA